MLCSEERLPWPVWSLTCVDALKKVPADLGSFLPCLRLGTDTYKSPQFLSCESCFIEALIEDTAHQFHLPDVTLGLRFMSPLLWVKVVTMVNCELERDTTNGNSLKYDHLTSMGPKERLFSAVE